jgi:hypothetical protein
MRDRSASMITLLESRSPWSVAAWACALLASSLCELPASVPLSFSVSSMLGWRSRWERATPVEA